MKLNKTIVGLGLAAGMLGVYAGAGFYLLPAIARQQLPSLIGGATGQQSSLRAVSFNPFTLQAELQGFVLSMADAKPLLSFDRLVVDLNGWESLRQRGVVLDSLVLHKPVGNIERRADGRFNFSDLQRQQPAADNAENESSGNVPVSIHHIALEEGQLIWFDGLGGRPVSETLVPVNLTISELTTGGDGRAMFELSLEAASGGRLDWRGDLSLAPFGSKGQLELNNLVLPKLWEMFLQDSLPLAITGGDASLQAYYVLNNSETGLALTVSNGSIDVKQFAATEKSQPDDTLIAIPELTVRGINADIDQRRIGVESVSSNAATIKAWLQADGRLNYQALFAGDSKPAVAAAADQVATPWQIQLNEVSLDQYQIQFTDRSQRQPVEMVFSELACKMQQFSNADAARLPLQFSTRVNRSGAISLNGDMVLAPFSADWKVELRDIPLRSFQAYLEPYLNLQLVDGDASAQGALTVQVAEALQVQFHGDANVDNLITRDTLKNKDFVRWTSLAVNQIAIDVAKQEFRFGKVAFEQPYVRFVIKKEGGTNIDDIIATAASPITTPETKAARHEQNKGAAPLVSIGNIELKDGRSDFADYSLILPFVAQMSSLSGEVNGFSSDRDAVAKLKLQGKVYDLATVKINGNYQLQSGDSDIVLNFSHMPLPLITPYMAEFAGYKIEKGQMALDLQYSIKHGELEARNKVFIDQLALGEHIENPKAVSLPLHLAIALLKDADGKINLDFPITGSLNDPKFSIGSLLVDVLGNLVTKIATSPFKALGSFLNSDQELSTIAFASGSGELAAGEAAKLDQIAKALIAKPELTLEIKGTAVEVRDWPVLRFDAVVDVLKKMKSGELRDKGEKIRSEYIELSEDEYKRLLAKFYGEMLPGEIEFTLLGKPRMKHNPGVDFYDVARMQLEAIMQPESQRLNDLAISRSNHIAKYLIERAGIDSSRIYILATELKTGDAGTGVNVQLSLNVAS